MPPWLRLELIFPYALPPVVSLVVCFLLASLTIKSGKTQQAKKLFTLLCLIQVVFNFNLLTGMLLKPEDWAWGMHRLAHLVFIFMLPVSLQFVHLLTGNSRVWLERLAYALTLSFVPLTQSSWYFSTSKVYAFGPFLQAGPALQVFTLFAIMAMIYGTVMLGQAYFQAKEPSRKRHLGFIVMGLPLSWSLILLNIFPALGYEVYPLSSFAFLPWSLMAYGLLESHLKEVGHFLLKKGYLGQFFSWLACLPLAGAIYFLLEAEQSVNFQDWSSFVQRLWPYGLPPLCSVMACFGLAFFCFRKAARQLETLLFGLFCMLWGMLSLEKILQMVIAQEAMALHVARLDHFFLVNQIGIGTHFFYRMVQRKERRLVIAAYAFAGLMMPLTQTPYYYAETMHHYASFGFFGQGRWAFEMFWVLGIAGLSWCTWLLWQSWRRETQPQRRFQFFYLFIGLILSATLNLGNVPATLGWEVYPLGNFTFIPILLMAYGIFRHDLLHINPYTKKRLISGALRALILLSYTGLFLVAFWATRDLDWQALQRHFVPHAWAPLFSCGCCIFVSWLALRLGHHNKEGLIFSMICGLYAFLNLDVLIGILVTDAEVALQVARWDHFALSFMLGLNLHLVYLLTQRAHQGQAVWLTYALGALLAPLTQTPLYFVEMQPHLWGFQPQTGIVFQLMSFIWLLGLGYGIYLLSQAYHQARERRQKRRIRLFFLGFIGVAVLNLSNIPAIYGYPIYSLGSFTFLPVLVLAYALFREHLKEILQIIRSGIWRGMVGAACLGIGSLPYALLSGTPAELRWALSILLVLWSYPLVRQACQGFLNLFLSDHRDELRTEFQALVEKFSRIHRFIELYQALSQVIFRELQSTGFTLLIADTHPLSFFGWQRQNPFQHSMGFTRSAPTSSAENAVEISVAHPLLPFFQQEHHLSHQEQWEEWMTEQQIQVPAQDLLRQAEWIQPVFFEGRLTCLLLLEAKIDGTLYSPEELIFLGQVGLVLGPYLENAHLLDQLEERIAQRTQQLQTAYDKITHINHMMQTVNSTLELDTVMTHVIEILHTVVNFDQVNIHLLHEKDQTLTFAKTYGSAFTPEQIVRIARQVLPVSERGSIFADPVRKNERVYYPWITPDLLEFMSPYDRTVYQIAPATAYLCYPLAVQNKVIGTLSFGNYGAPFTFSEEQLTTMQQYVTPIALALHNAKLYAEIKEAKEIVEEHTQELENSHAIISRQNAIFRALLQTSTLIQQTKELEELFQATLQPLSMLFEAHIFGIILHGHRPEIIESAAFRGMNTTEQEVLLQHHEALLVAQEAGTLATLLAEAAGGLAQISGEWQILPMWGREGRLAGKLIVRGPKLDQPAREIISVFLEQLSAVADNKLLTRELEKFANTDALTGVYNRAYFNKEIERLIQNSQRFSTICFSLLLIDVNGLKRVNDVFGHADGDSMIIRVAQLLMSICRKSDIITRLGGDEYIVLCPSTGEEQARRLLQRIREEEQKTYLLCHYPDGTEEKVPIRLSIGLASSETVPPEEVMKQADLRMYEDKQAFYAHKARYR